METKEFATEWSESLFLLAILTQPQTGGAILATLGLKHDTSSSDTRYRLGKLFKTAIIIVFMETFFILLLKPHAKNENSQESRPCYDMISQILIPLWDRVNESNLVWTNKSKYIIGVS